MSEEHDHMSDVHRHLGTSMDLVWDLLPDGNRPGQQHHDSVSKHHRIDIPDVLAATDIVSLIGESIEVRKAGKDFQALCPFHDEKTASFTISHEKQFYHCFGCGAHGDALKWMQEYHRMSFRQALEALAGSAGMSLSPVDRGESRKRRAVALQADIEAAAWPEIMVLDMALSERVSYRQIDARTRERFPHIKAPTNAPTERERLAAKRLAVALYALYGAKA